MTNSSAGGQESDRFRRIIDRIVSCFLTSFRSVRGGASTSMAEQVGSFSSSPRPASDAVLGRRKTLTEMGAPTDGMPEPESLGLAFSGGGIRSATICLGAAQALSKRERLLDFDYLSTVSGGGYTGSFLTSLFIPARWRGLGELPDGAPDPLELREQREFAERVLGSLARDRKIAPPGGHGPDIRSPIWWLREHGRYLAPNGATDYATSAAYLVRNWLAMLYVFALPTALFFAVITTVGIAARQADLLICNVPAGTLLAKAMQGEIALQDVSPAADAVRQPVTPIEARQPAGLNKTTATGPNTCSTPPSAKHAVFSWVFVLTPGLLFIVMAAGIAYWLTAWQPMMRIGAGTPPRRRYMSGAVCYLASCMGLTWLLTLSGDGDQFGARMFAFGALALSGSGAVIAILAGIKEWSTPPGAFVASVRRRLTRVASNVSLILIFVLAIAVVDSLALALIARMGGSKVPIFASTLLPIGAFLINKLPGWLGGRDGTLFRWFSAHLSVAALIVGVLLFGGFAVLIDALVQYLLWPSIPWPAVGPFPAPLFVFCFVLAICAAVLLTGLTDGFVNLSSLHNLYAARLTRAYLGGSNTGRLAPGDDEALDIRETHAGDDMPIDGYSRFPSAAPIHLVNVTLNETRSREGSQLIDRDRKGVPVIFAPEGILIDPACTQESTFPWGIAEEYRVERLTLGQLCAISGAAASPGMGSRSTLGTALTLTFGNIRLGYWWRIDNMIRKRPLAGLMRIGGPVRTFFYLFNEMTSRYSRNYPRLYLSDGGHFDNSGAYELLRRGIGTLLVYDNGADPQYRFEDLEQLVRKARIDLGLSINVCSDDTVAELFGASATSFFLNCPSSDKDEYGADWRSRAVAKGGCAVALLLCAFDRNAARPGVVPNPRHYIVWMKPRCSEALPQDVQGYGLAQPDFPHQSTVDQFFDEAQWESYRALGEAMTITLLSGTTAGVDVLRKLALTLAAAPRAS